MMTTMPMIIGKNRKMEKVGEIYRNNPKNKGGPMKKIPVYTKKKPGGGKRGG